MDRAEDLEGRRGVDELDYEQALRPRTLKQFVGQAQIKRELRIWMDAALQRGETLDHVLLYGPPGLGKCITADSLILTERGWIPFYELIPESLEKDTSLPREIRVRGLHGLELTSHIYASGFGPTRRVVTRSGFEIEGTPNHAVLVATPAGPQWKRLDRLSTDDYVAIGRGLNVWGETQPVIWQSGAATDRRVRTEVAVSHWHAGPTEALGRPPAIVELRQAYAGGVSGNPTPEWTAKRLGLFLSDGRVVEVATQPWTLATEPATEGTRTLSLDADLAYFLGVLVGDGHFERGGNFPAFVITSGEPELQSELLRIVRKHFGQAPEVRQYGNKTARIRFSQRYGHVMLAWGVRAVTAHEKVVPSAVLTGPRTVAVGFLQGLFDANGNGWPEGYVEWRTRSEILSKQVQLLLANLGIIAHRTEKQVKGTSFWQLFIGGQDAARFHEEVGFRLTRKRARSKGLEPKPRGWSRSDLVPCVKGLLRALLEMSCPHSRAVHKKFEHVKQDDRIPTRQQIKRYLSMLPDWVTTTPEFGILRRLIDPAIYWDQVACLTESTSETFDFVVPGSHSFVANGFFNHNTTLSHIVANEMNTYLHSTSGPAIERPGDLAAILTNLEEESVLFIDEIHRLNRAVEEVLYPAMEDFQLDIVIGKGPSARTLKIDLPKFTLIGATTRAGLLTSPLRDRFGIVQRIGFYTVEDLQVIVTNSARVLGVVIDPEGAHEIARRSRGTPRVANRLLRRARDYAEVRGDGRVTEALARECLEMLRIDELGLDPSDQRFLRTIMEKFDGGPVGLDTLAAALSEERETIEDVYEPYLLQLGFLQRTPRGRMATPRAYEHLGQKDPQTPAQKSLF